MKGKIFRIKEEKEYEEKLNNEQNDSKLDLALSNQNQEDKTSNDNKNIQDEDIIDEEIEKEKENAKKIEEEKEAFKKVVKILKQDKEERTKDDNNLLKEYLSAHYKYFSDLLRQSEERFLKLIPVLKYESFKANERIVNFGEEGDKCYVLLKGTVGIYKPFPITKRMTLKQYVEYLANVRDEEKNKVKFERILNYNSRIDKNQLYLIDFNPEKVPSFSSGLTIVLEEERELAIEKAGFSFGEMALIKNEPRNASIVALERCILISIEKGDYTKIVKDIEEQRLIRELASFKEKYPIFKFWPSSKCFPLMSGLITQEVARDEYIYKQNEFPTDVYFIKEGIYEVTTYFNFDTYERYIEYIHDTTHSLIPHIDNPFEWKEDKIARRIEVAFQKNLSPFIVNLELEDKVILSHKEEDDLAKKDAAKNIEDELTKNKKYVFKSNIQKLYAPDIFGFVEALELKQRLTNIKCISPSGSLVKFPLREFLQLLPTDKRNNFYLQQRIYEEKKYLMAQLKNTAVAKLNFVKIDIDKNLFITKNFFRPKPRKRNILEFKKKLNIVYTSDILNPVPSTSKQLIKSNSSINYNISNISNNSKLFSNDTSTIHEEINGLPVEPYHKYSRNIFINGFKSSIITLTKKKINAIKYLYPLEELRNKPSFISSNSIKEIDNSDDDYVKYLGNNMQYAKTPHRVGNNDLSRLGLMTGKKYVSFEANQIINEINRKNKLMRNITLEQKNNELILPKVKFNFRSSKKNKSDIVKIKKIKFKGDNI